MARTALALLGLLASLAWAAVFVRAPGAAMELLVVASPVVVALWLVVTLTAPARRRSAPAATPPRPDDTSVRDSVLSRDHRICSSCHSSAGSTVIARRPARAAEPDPLARFVTLCDACASTSALAHSHHIRTI